MKEKNSIKRGDIVRSSLNVSYLYRVVSIGPKRAVLSVHQGPYLRCYCAPSILSKAS